MSNKFLTALLVALAVVLGMAGLMLILPRAGKAGDGSSAENSLADIDMWIVPGEMPEGITMDVPDDFTETASQFYKKYYVKDDASIIVTGEKMEFSYAEVDSYTDSVIMQYQDAVDEFQMVSDESITVSGLHARLLEFTYAIVGSEERQDLACTTAVMMKGDRVYLVTCKSRRDTFSKYREEFRMILNTIRLTDVPEDSVPVPENSGDASVMTVPAEALTENQQDSETADSGQP